jgi:hypothetical protein
MKTKTLMLILAIVLIAGFTAVLAQTNTATCPYDDPNAPPPELCLQTTVNNQAVLLDDDPNAPPPPELS